MSIREAWYGRVLVSTIAGSMASVLVCGEKPRENAKC